MPLSNLDNKVHSPVAIGGVGGSGTRIVAQLLMELGFYIGDDLNKANDNLWFVLLFNRVEILSIPDNQFKELLEIFLNRMTSTKELTKLQVALINSLPVPDGPHSLQTTDWFRKRVDSLLSTSHVSPQQAWGWKVPTIHIFIHRVQKFLPTMKYIHVVRNGLDMAHSRNQNQLKYWGPYFIGEHYDMTPRYSLRYWHEVHKRVLECGENMGSRFLFLNYDKLCLDPENSIKGLTDFLGVKVSDLQIGNLSSLVQPPRSIGRFKQYGLDMFNQADVAFVKQLGFDISLD